MQTSKLCFYRDGMMSQKLGHLCLCASELCRLLVLLWLSLAVCWSWSGRWGSCRGGFLAVRRHEDDKLGCHSPPFSLISCGVPGWTSVSPRSLWRAAPPVRSNTQCLVLEGGAAAIWHRAPACLSFGRRGGVFREGAALL